jgi:hypothetical protein
MFFVPRMQPSASAALTFVVLTIGLSEANPDAKRLYDDLLSNYNKLIRPVNNHSEKVTVKLGMRLSQLVDLVSSDVSKCFTLTDAFSFICFPSR